MGPNPSVAEVAEVVETLITLREHSRLNRHLHQLRLRLLPRRLLLLLTQGEVKEEEKEEEGLGRR